MKYKNLNYFQDLPDFIKSSQLIKFTNCYLCQDSKLIVEDLWIKEGKIQDAEQLFYVDQVKADLIIDCDGAIISPGFIDIQINGGFGYDFSDTTTDINISLNVVSKKLVEFGVTGFCPTLVCSNKNLYIKALDNNYKTSEGNSQVLGFHLEGPFLSAMKCGMHDTKLIPNDFGEDPSKTLLEMYGNNFNKVKYVTLAPELPNSCEVIKYLVNRGISVSLGHSAANFDQGVAAIQCGANMLTHLFCSMSPFHHRDPHLVGLLTYECTIPDSPRLYYGLITDLVHTHATAIRIAHRANNKGLIVVTDANCALGMKDGVYHFGSRDIEVINEKSYVKGTDILAGGTTPLDQCMRNYWWATGIDRVEALDAVTSHPADALKIGQSKGYLKSGFDADLVILSYKTMNVSSTWINGKLVYANAQSDVNMKVVDN